MTLTIKQTEGAPTNYPAISGLSDAADLLNKGALWRRIELHVIYRWGEREVLWTVEGAGEWVPPLTPGVINTVSVWNGTGWEAATLDMTPLGYLLLDETYLFDATVGSVYTDGVPDDVAEAFRRLAEYHAAEDPLPPGVNQYTVELGSGGVQETISRNAAHTAKALVNSGAADLLRPYRRL
jgi:hypothetical protein